MLMLRQAQQRTEPLKSATQQKLNSSTKVGLIIFSTYPHTESYYLIVKLVSIIFVIIKTL